MTSTGSPRRLRTKIAATVNHPKTEIGNGFGFFAHLVDTEGNRVGLHSMG